MGRPKATITGDDGVPWLARAIHSLCDAGCAPVYVVLGAGHSTALATLRAHRPANCAGIRIVTAADWHHGMGSSLRVGLQRIINDARIPRDTAATVNALAIQLVDTPDIGSQLVCRVTASSAPSTLARACFHGRPGHPVVIGRDHWEPLVKTLGGDVGARTYLDSHDVTAIECADLATGQDYDEPWD